MYSTAYQLPNPLIGISGQARALSRSSENNQCSPAQAQLAAVLGKNRECHAWTCAGGSRQGDRMCTIMTAFACATLHCLFDRPLMDGNETKKELIGKAGIAYAVMTTDITAELDRGQTAQERRHNRNDLSLPVFNLIISLPPPSLLFMLQIRQWFSKVDVSPSPTTCAGHGHSVVAADRASPIKRNEGRRKHNSWSRSPLQRCKLSHVYWHTSDMPRTEPSTVSGTRKCQQTTQTCFC